MPMMPTEALLALLQQQQQEILQLRARTAELESLYADKTLHERLESLKAMIEAQPDNGRRYYIQSLNEH